MTVIDRDTIGRLRGILDDRPADEIDEPALKRASVLIPLIENEGRWSLLFVKRSENLTLHRGQVAFPGGGADSGELLESAAMRETEEEVGVPRDQIELIGRLDDLTTRTGFLVAPFVGLIPARFPYVLQASEVEQSYEVPLEALLDRENPRVRYVEYMGARIPAYSYIHGSLEIWGLTGRILKMFLDLLRLAV